MKKNIAFCHTNVGDCLDLIYLKQLLPDYDIMHGFEALALISSGELSAVNVLVIQECNSKTARKLRKKGAIPLVNYCWESQIYANVFYSKLQQIAQSFKYRIYFNGMFDGLKNCDVQNNFAVCYPGISDYTPEPINWEDRDFVALVMGNKYVEQSNVFPAPTIKVDKYLKWFFRLFFETKTQKFLRENELQNKRLELIEYFGNKGLLKMFGNGWANLDEIPETWQKKIEGIVKELAPKPVDDKLGAISKFKFNLAVENMSYKGYVTEKILESMVANTIPVYLGAPDIANYIPKNCFIDQRDFESLDELYSYMKNMTAEQAQGYLDSAQAFLRSNEGQKYTPYSHSKLLTELVHLYEKETAS